MRAGTQPPGTQAWGDKREAGKSATASTRIANDTEQLQETASRELTPLPGSSRDGREKIGDSELRIEILYVPECPHLGETLANINEVLRTEGVHSEIEHVAITDAQSAEATRFHGSPSIRINGLDIEGEMSESKNFGMNCRLYPGETRQGVPPKGMIQAAVRRHLGGRKR